MSEHDRLHDQEVIQNLRQSLIDARTGWEHAFSQGPPDYGGEADNFMFQSTLAHVRFLESMLSTADRIRRIR